MLRRTGVFVFLLFGYWLIALYLFGAFSFASICHYSDEPGCKTDMTFPIAIMAISTAIYCLLIIYFIRHIRRIRSKGL